MAVKAYGNIIKTSFCSCAFLKCSYAFSLIRWYCRFYWSTRSVSLHCKMDVKLSLIGALIPIAVKCLPHSLYPFQITLFAYVGFSSSISPVQMKDYGHFVPYIRETMHSALNL